MSFLKYNCVFFHHVARIYVDSLASFALLVAETFTPCRIIAESFVGKRSHPALVLKRLRVLYAIWVLICSLIESSSHRSTIAPENTAKPERSLRREGQ